MAYPDITDYGLRLPYDLDGTVMTARSYTDAGLERTFSTAEMNAMNNAATNGVSINFGTFPAGLTPGAHYGELRMLFPEPMIITAVSLRGPNADVQPKTDWATWLAGGGIGWQSVGWFLEGSADARSLSDGVWAEPLYPNGDVIYNVTTYNYAAADNWRTYIWKTNFTFGPLTAIRFNLANVGATDNSRVIYSLHVYGLRADVTGEDLEFVKSNKTQETTLIDYGNVAYPTAYERSYFVMNTSLSKVAKNVKVFPLTESNTRPGVIDLSLTTGVYPQPIIDSNVSDPTDFFSSAPPASTQGQAQEISTAYISINTLNSVKPVYATFVGSCTTVGYGNSGFNNHYVSLYANDTLIAESVLNVDQNSPQNHNFNVTTYFEEPNIYTYRYKIWAPTWGGVGGSGIFSTSRTMSITVESRALLAGNLGPREARQIFVLLSPGAGSSPIAYRLKTYAADGWTPQGFSLAQAQAQVA